VTRQFARERIIPPLLFATVAAFFVLPNNVALNKVYYALVMPVVLLSMGNTDYRRLVQHPMLRWSTAFILFMTLSAAWSPANGEGPASLLIYGASTLLFILLVSSCERRWLDRLPDWCAAIVVLHAATILAAWYSRHGIAEPLEGIGRLDHQLELAQVYASIAAMCLVHGMRAGRPMRWVHLGAVAICLLAILLTGRRAPLLAFAAVGTLNAAAHRSAHTAKFIAGLAAAGAALVLLLPQVRQALVERGTSMRADIWVEGWHRIDQNGAWMLGNGSGASAALAVGNMAIRHYHDIFLATLFYGGVAGTALLCGLLAVTVIRGIRAPAAQPWLAAFCVGIGCLLTNGDRLVIHPHPVWLYFWLPATLIAIYSTAPSNTENPTR
jgi:hypothetical protein